MPLADGAVQGLTGVVRTFQSTHPDMNRPAGESAAPAANFGASALGADLKPFFNPGAAPAVAAFEQWFNDAPGVNQSSVHSLYFSNTNQPDANTFAFNSANWQPAEGERFFTYEAHAAITYTPGQSLAVKSSGDMWIFIDRMLVPGLNLHGVHAERSFIINLDLLGLTTGEA